ncbi:hypothetical protein NYE33_13565 [Paenibacillus sp. FSL R10-2199]
MRALLDGYERELTEEEQAYVRIAEAYDYCANGRGARSHAAQDSAYAQGIKFTLNTLNIVIPGVNDTEVRA